MSREALSLPPLLAYADPVSGTWGVVAGRDEVQMAVGELAGGEARARTDDLRATPRDAGVTVTDPDPGLALVRVSGPPLGDDQASAGGVRHLGQKAIKADSVRLLCAWFSPERGMALVAVRPPRARGQDRDELSAICVGEQDGMSAFDPRLSSTYGGHGSLRRVGVELWLGENEEADMYSLRMAGEATGAAATLQVGGVTVRAQPFHCHSRGEAGAGVYLLISGS